MNIEQVPPRYRNRIHLSENGCWLWKGSRDTRGHGHLRCCGHLVGAHRFFFELLIGPIPDGFELHHKCQIKHCVNPDHLEVLTRLDHRRRHWLGFCRRGHELIPENIFWKQDGNRQCRICRNQANRNGRIRRKEQFHGQ